MLLFRYIRALIIGFALSVPIMAYAQQSTPGAGVAVISQETDNYAYISYSGTVVGEGWTKKIGANQTISFLSGNFNGTASDGYDDIACVDFDENDDAFIFSQSSPGSSDPVLWTNAIGDSSKRYYYFLSGDYNGDGNSDIATFYRDFSGSNPLEDVKAKISFGPSGATQTADAQDWSLPNEISAGFVSGKFINSSGQFADSNDATYDIAAISLSGSDYNIDFYAGPSGQVAEASWQIATLSATSNPVAFGAGDFNGDGRSDVAIVFYDTADHIYRARIAFGTNGDVALQKTWVLGNTAFESILFQDYNADGKWDIAAVADNHAGGRTATIYFGSSTGAFASQTTWQLNGSKPVTTYLAGNFGRQKSTLSGAVSQKGGIGGLGNTVLTVKTASTNQTIGTVYSSDDGQYSLANLVNDSYVVSPAKGLHQFSPTTRSFTVANADVTNQNFDSANNPVGYAISGKVFSDATQTTGLENVLITVEGGNALTGTYKKTARTDSTGYYSIAVTTGSFTVTPTNMLDADFEFSPASNSVIINSGDASNINFIGGNDECPDDPKKSAPGVCGCGIADIDANGNGIVDCLEVAETCPSGSLKATPGLCGCDREDIDDNGNGICDFDDSAMPKYTIEGRLGILDANGNITKGVGGVVIHSAVGQTVTRTLADVEAEFPNATDKESLVGTFKNTKILQGKWTFWVRTGEEDNLGYSVSRYFQLNVNSNRSSCPDRKATKVNSSGGTVDIDDNDRSENCKFDPLVVSQDLKGIDFKVNGCISGWVADDNGYCIKWRGLDAPTDVTATRGEHGDKVNVSWAATLGASEYRVYRAQFTSFQNQINQLKSQSTASLTDDEILSAITYSGEVQIGTTSGLTIEDKTAIPGVKYVYAVKAHNRYTTSDYSDPTFGWRATSVAGGDTGSGGTTPTEEPVNCSEPSDTDSDGDGVSNSEEIAMGTDPCDRGSYITKLTSPVYTKYNTYLDQANFLELVSIGTADVNARISIYNILGKKIGASRRVTIKSGNQVDLNIREWVGKADTYGLVKIEFNDTDPGINLAGRLSVYRENVGQENLSASEKTYSFVFTRELRNPIRGTTYATTNSSDPQGAGNFVGTWVEIVNLENKTRSFNVRIYDQSGKLLWDRENAVNSKGKKLGPVKVGGLAEADIQGGHEFGKAAYLIEVIPSDGATRYFATAARYGSIESPVPQTNEYNFAVQIEAKAGSQARQIVPISNMSGECWSQTNWLELVNTSDSKVTTKVKFRNEKGTIVGTSSVTLKAHQQKQLNAGALLPSGQVGIADIGQISTGSLLAQSMVYYHDCQENALQSGYAVSAVVPGGEVQIGSYNRFLSLKNFLTIMNASNATVEAALRLRKSGTTTTQAVDKVSLARNASTLLNLSDEQQFDTEADSYGTVRVSTSRQNTIGAVNVRLREMEGKVDFAIPTAVR